VEFPAVFVKILQFAGLLRPLNFVFHLHMPDSTPSTLHVTEIPDNQRVFHPLIRHQDGESRAVPGKQEQLMRQPGENPRSFTEALGSLWCFTARGVVAVTVGYGDYSHAAVPDLSHHLVGHARAGSALNTPGDGSERTPRLTAVAPVCTRGLF
jgi:hypothetical protein